MSNPNTPAQSSDSSSVYPEGALEAFAAYYGVEPKEATEVSDEYDFYDVPEDPLAGSCDPTGGFPR